MTNEPKRGLALNIGLCNFLIVIVGLAALFTWGTYALYMLGGPFIILALLGLLNLLVVLGIVTGIINVGAIA